MSRKVIVSCDQNGGVFVDAEGFQGIDCKDATKVFETAYLAGSRSGEDKPEAYGAPISNTQGLTTGRF